MNYFLGVFYLFTVFLVSQVQSECNKDKAQKSYEEIRKNFSTPKDDSEYLNLYMEMEGNLDFARNLFDCDDDVEDLWNKWDQLQVTSLKKVKKFCPDFEASYAQLKNCRQSLDIYNFDEDQAKYCKTFKRCKTLHQESCPHLRKHHLLQNSQSNASSYFCSIECDDIQKLRRVLENCWASVHTLEKSNNLFKTFYSCVSSATKPTCQLSMETLYGIFPIFCEHPQGILTEGVTEKPETKCIQDWKNLQDIENLTPDMCRTLENIESCISKFFKGNDRKYREKVAKCQYSWVNLIRTEALHQATSKSPSAPSSAGNLASGVYHFAVVGGLVAMVTRHLN